jgi:hypothetical protein
MEVKHENFTIILHHDCDVESPLEDQGRDSAMIFCAWQRNSILSDANPFDTPDDALAHAKRNGFDVFPMRGYIHSGVAYCCDPVGRNSYPFTCPWDSGFAGFVLVKRSEFPERKKADKGLRQRVANSLCETVTQWANGDTYWYEIRDESGECLDSCGGYIGAEFAMECAREASASLNLAA